MDDRTPAEELPTLYRAVLDTVMRLEHAGDRAFAFGIRRDALRTYSTRWDERGRASLVALDRKAKVRLATVPNTAVHTSLTTSIEPA